MADRFLMQAGQNSDSRELAVVAAALTEGSGLFPALGENEATRKWFETAVLKELQEYDPSAPRAAKEYRWVILNAGDAMALVGNEPGINQSVEAMLGNAGSMRVVMNWHTNPVPLAGVHGPRDATA